MKWRRWLLVGLALVAAYLSAWPTPIDPARWDPPPAPGLVGPYQPNARLAEAQWLARGVGVGPESTAVDRLGRVHAGSATVGSSAYQWMAGERKLSRTPGAGRSGWRLMATAT